MQIKLINNNNTDHIYKSYVPHLEILRTTFISLTDHIYKSYVPHLY